MRNRFLPITLAALTVLVTACSDNEAPPKQDPEVFVVLANEQPYRPQQKFSARIKSRSDVNITAQVSGKLLAIHFKEGDQIAKGHLMFEIDRAPYEAALSRARAELSKAKANQKSAINNYERGRALVKDKYISQAEYDNLEARMLESKAATKAAEAALESAQVDLDYTRIFAPQDGQVGRANPSIGDVVSPQYGVLTTLVGQDDMEVVFQLPEKLLLAARGDSVPTAEDIVVSVIMPDGSEYPYTGTISYFSNRVDATTGTMEVSARLPNPDDLLRPGMYVQAVVRLKEPLQGLMIPQAALQVDQRGTYVLAVDDNDMVTRLNVSSGERIGENVLITSGLNVATRVIVRGVQKARPGMKVVASMYQPAAAAQSDAEGPIDD
ncbi:MAG: efflux RND transporter periplasmic adaptor subunit [Pseudomonadota bacterium]|nr:efflux RND transporter periplasmic adaptor subunit [Pseudomonadota bacterium]